MKQNNLAISLASALGVSLAFIGFIIFALYSGKIALVTQEKKSVPYELLGAKITVHCTATEYTRINSRYVIVTGYADKTFFGKVTGGYSFEEIDGSLRKNIVSSPSWGQFTSLMERATSDQFLLVASACAGSGEKNQAEQTR